MAEEQVTVKDLEAAEANVKACRQAAERARNEQNSAETRLANLRIRFTQQVAKHVDISTLDEVRRADSRPISRG